VSAQEGRVTLIDAQAIESLSKLFLQGGAIVALVWIVVLLTSGKLHTSSEVEGLRKDKSDLLTINERMSEALEQSNKLLEDLVGKARR
jgi:hypothetical protein